MDIPKVKSIMKRKLIFIGPQTSVSEIIETLLINHMTEVIVAEKDVNNVLHLKGFVSEKQCLDCLANSSFYHDEQNKHAKDIMVKEQVAATPEEDIFQVEAKFHRYFMRHIPVIKDDELVGVIYRRDILKTAYELLKRINGEDSEKVHEVHIPGPFDLRLTSKWIK